MNEPWIIILLHQLLFQGMFVIKNVMLYKKLGMQIRGKNAEATASIAFFTLFIVLAMLIAVFKPAVGEVHVLDNVLSFAAGLLLLLLNLLLSAASLIGMRDSWRVGVLEDQKTELITTGIYRFTRNPYFVSYLLMLIAYALILKSMILLGLCVIGFLLVHRMILKEETYLRSVHGDEYAEYQKRVPRYLLI